MRVLDQPLHQQLSQAEIVQSQKGEIMVGAAEACACLDKPFHHKHCQAGIVHSQKDETIVGAAEACACS